MIEDAKAGSVWGFFREIAAIPRRSGHEEAICRLLVEFAKEHGLKSRSDEAGNVVIRLDATAGCEDATGIVLQSHVDMVCTKLAGVEHDFLTDGITLIEKDGWVCADGTTLGADDGIGVAMALAVAVEGGLEHGSIELLFTVGEEAGLIGAQAMDGDFITGKRLINLDSESDVFTVGCAGGEQSEIVLPVDIATIDGDMSGFRLAVTGLYGGHSGVDIHLGRGNAIKIMAGLIETLNVKYGVRLANIEGGSAHNAIPIEAGANVYVEQGKVEEAMAEVSSFIDGVVSEFAEADPGIAVGFDRLVDISGVTAMTAESSGRVIKLLMDMPSGVESFSEDFEDVVETSCNLAVVQTLTDGSAIIVKSSKRSCKEAGLEVLRNRVLRATGGVGATVERTSKYPAWEPDGESALLKTAIEVYKRINGREPIVEIIHAGLECSIIGRTCPGMDMISIGPTIEQPHCPQERVNVESVDKAWELLLELLRALR